MSSEKQGSRQRLRLTRLIQNPGQESYYDACLSADDDALLENLHADGQRDPIVVVPSQNRINRVVSYLILDGHRRARLLAQLGETHVDAIVRDDLADADEETIEREFLQFNFLRRQLHPLDKAAIARRLFELDRQRTLRPDEDQADARDRVGAMIGMGGRNLDRYWRVLRTPRAIQVALRDGFLKLDLASKIDGLSLDSQHELANRIASAAESIREADQGGDKSEAHRLRRLLIREVESHVGEQLASHRTRETVFRSFFDAIRRILPGMSDVIDHIRLELIRDAMPSLLAMRKVIDRLVKRRKSGLARQRDRQQR